MHLRLSNVPWVLVVVVRLSLWVLSEELPMLIEQRQALGRLSLLEVRRLDVFFGVHEVDFILHPILGHVDPGLARS